MARPKVYETSEELEAGVERYFNTIRTATLDGLVTEWRRPPTVAGLCLSLGINRRTWARYCNDPAFQAVTDWAQMEMEAYLEEELLSPHRKSTHGIEFNLQNNYGWRAKREVELGGETRQTVAQAAGAANLSLSEKLALIQEAAKELPQTPPREGGMEAGELG